MATIEKRGQGQFRARIRRHGLEPLTRTFPTRALAQAWARDIEHRLAHGEALPSLEAARTTLAEALDRYAREITPQKRGASQERRRIARWKAQPLAQRTLAAIRGTDLAQWRDERLTEVGADSVRLELAIVSNLYTIARTEWGMESLANPAKNIRKPKPGASRERRLVGDEERRLTDAAGPILKAGIILAIETAMRRGELAGARREHLDLQQRTLHLPKTKNGEARTIPLSRAACEALRGLPARLDGYLLGWPGTVADDLTHGFRGLCAALGIEGLRFHDLRHEAVSRLFERGFSVAEVAAISGHKTWSQLRRYTQLRATTLLERLDATAMRAA
jgi:integrase